MSGSYRIPTWSESRDCGYDTPCEVFLGAKDEKGYGRCDKRRNGEQSAHRDAWVAEHGPIPQGHDIHHLCENPPCIRIDHLQPMRRSEHWLHTPWGINSQRTHCKHGHEFTPENTVTRPNGTRECRECGRRRSRDHQRRRRAAA